GFSHRRLIFFTVKQFVLPVNFSSLCRWKDCFFVRFLAKDVHKHLPPTSKLCSSYVEVYVFIVLSCPVLSLKLTLESDNWNLVPSAMGLIRQMYQQSE
ncbi:hypothetical protein L9F63_021025, partial [Diploptera punctata]